MISNEEVQALIDEVREDSKAVSADHPKLVLIKSLVHALVGRRLDVDSAEQMVAREYRNFPMDAGDFYAGNPLHQELVSTYADLLVKVYLTMEEVGIVNPLHFITI